jgi:hypothetical protein
MTFLNLMIKIIDSVNEMYKQENEEAEEEEEEKYLTENTSNKRNKKKHPIFHTHKYLFKFIRVQRRNSNLKHYFYISKKIIIL